VTGSSAPDKLLRRERSADHAGTATTAVTESDRRATLEAIERRSEEIKRAELDEALDKLEQRGALDDRQRAAVAAAADAIVRDLLSAPREAIRETNDQQALETALELFGPD